VWLASGEVCVWVASGEVCVWLASGVCVCGWLVECGWLVVKCVCVIG